MKFTKEISGEGGMFWNGRQSVYGAPFWLKLRYYKVRKVKKFRGTFTIWKNEQSRNEKSVILKTTPLPPRVDRLNE